LILADVLYPPKTSLPRHVHDRAYFCLIHQGNYTERYFRRRRICEPAMLVFHPPGEHHSETFGDSPVESFNVEIGPAWVDRIYEVGGRLDQPAEFRGGEVAALGRRLFREFRRNDADSVVAIESIVLEILVSCGRALIPPGSDEPNWLREARDLLDADAREALSLRSVARQVGIHPVHLAAMFRRFHGCSVGEYVRLRRFDRARRMVADTGYSLAQVALDSGFADQSHLTRTFRQFAGMTPLQYRTFQRFKTRSLTQRTISS